MTSSPRAGVAAPAIEIAIQSARWSAFPRATQVVRRAIKAAAPRCAEVSVLLTDDNRIRKLNREWRGQDKPTNVLSFPAVPAARPSRTSGRSRAAMGEKIFLGDMIIAYQTTAREALADHKPFAHHLAHLAVHGFLHLLGYDHESDEDAEAMEKLERRILSRIAIPDPYVTRAVRL